MIVLGRAGGMLRRNDASRDRITEGPNVAFSTFARADSGDGGQYDPNMRDRALHHHSAHGRRDGRSPGEHRRRRTRAALGVGDGDRLVLQPTRAIPRKNVGGGMGVAAALGATYWLLGPAEDGFDGELEALVEEAACPVRLGAASETITVDAAYQACDVVVLPSTWEGFGNPSIESVVHRRPLSIGPYPVAEELAAFGFDWFALSETDRLASWLESPDEDLLDHNAAVASAHFSLRDLPDRITGVLPDL